MPRYALLILPAFNRVYGESSVRLTRNELAVFSARALEGEVLASEETRIGGVPYVTFDTAGPLGPRNTIGMLYCPPLIWKILAALLMI